MAASSAETTSSSEQTGKEQAELLLSEEKLDQIAQYIVKRQEKRELLDYLIVLREEYRELGQLDKFVNDLSRCKYLYSKYGNFPDGQTLLQRCSWKGFEEITLTLLKMGVREVEPDSSEDALCFALESCNTNIATHIFNYHIKDKRYSHDNLLEYLIKAVVYGHDDIFNEILERVADLESFKKIVDGLFYEAVRMNRSVMAAKLLEKGANVDAFRLSSSLSDLETCPVPCPRYDSDDYNFSRPLSPLSHRYGEEREPETKPKYEYQMSLVVGRPSQNNKMKITPLLLALYHGYNDMVGLLLRHSADPRIGHLQDNKTALHLCIVHNWVDEARIILSNGASVLAMYKESFTALHFAVVCMREDVEMVRLLLQHYNPLVEELGCMITAEIIAQVRGNSSRWRGRRFLKGPLTLLELAAFRGNHELTQLFLSAEVSSLRAVSTYESPLLFATRSYFLTERLAHVNGDYLPLPLPNLDPDFFRLLIEQSSDIDEKAKGIGITPLMGLCDSLIDADKDFSGRNEKTIELIRIFLNAGANVNAVHEDSGYTPLLLAVQRGNEEAVKVLLEAGADVYASLKNGDTALNIAIANNHHALVKLLLEANDQKAAEGVEIPAMSINYTTKPLVEEPPSKERLIIILSLLNAKLLATHKISDAKAYSAQLKHKGKDFIIRLSHEYRLLKYWRCFVQGHFLGDAFLHRMFNEATTVGGRLYSQQLLDARDSPKTIELFLLYLNFIAYYDEGKDLRDGKLIVTYDSRQRLQGLIPALCGIDPRCIYQQPHQALSYTDDSNYGASSSSAGAARGHYPASLGSSSSARAPGSRSPETRSSSSKGSPSKASVRVSTAGSTTGSLFIGKPKPNDGLPKKGFTPWKEGGASTTRRSRR